MGSKSVCQTTRLPPTVPKLHLAVSQNKGTLYRPQYTIILIMGTLNEVPLILGNTHLGDYEDPSEGLGCMRPKGLGFMSVPSCGFLGHFPALVLRQCYRDYANFLASIHFFLSNSCGCNWQVQPLATSSTGRSQMAANDFCLCLRSSSVASSVSTAIVSFGTAAYVSVTGVKRPSS